MSKAPPPVLGFNNNVRHRGRVFHIQTEDSGVKSPRIVTHLFADGGRIIKTTRIDYSGHLGGSDLTNTVRQLMKEQHKAMFAALRDGRLDDLLEAACGPLPLPPAPHESGEITLSSSDAEIRARSLMPVTPEPPRAPESQAPAASRSLTNPNLRRMVPSVPPPSPEAIERAVAALDPSLASPALLRGPGPAKSEPSRPRASNPAVARKLRTPLPPQPVDAIERTPVGRPASRYGSVPSKSARSIFGDGVISEKSLDEVILSYLADDLEGSSE